MSRSIATDTESLPLTITIGIDGRLYFSEMTPELLAIAECLCPQDPQLTERIKALRTSRNHERSGSQTRAGQAAGPSDSLGRA